MRSYGFAADPLEGQRWYAVRLSKLEPIDIRSVLSGRIIRLETDFVLPLAVGLEHCKRAE